MPLRLVTSESTLSYFEAPEGYLADHGRPVACYSDKHTAFPVVQQGAKSGNGMTQFGRAMNELNIEILCANSSQPKGSVEPDRLRDVFCFRDECLVSKQLAFFYEHQRIIPAENEIARDLPGK